MENKTVITGGSPQGLIGRFWAAFLRLALPYKVGIIAGILLVLVGVVFLVMLVVFRPQQLTNTPPGGSPTRNDTTGQVTQQPEDPQEPQSATSDATPQSGSSSGSSGGQSATPGGTDGSSSGGTGSSGEGGGGDTSPPLVCAAFPSFPDANCTGWQHTGATLQACDTELTTNNGVYENCLFDGGIVVVGTNMTVKNSKITGIVSANWDANGSLRGLTLIDVEIDGSVYDDPFGQAAIGIDNYTCIRCNVHHTGRGANFRNNVRLEDSYFHDFAYVDGAHQSGVGSNGGSGNTILHNNIECNGVGGSGCSGALVMYGDFDPVDDILVQQNLFNTDGSFCTYAGSAGVSSGKPYPNGTNIRYIDNRFGKKYYSTCGDLGPVTAWEYNSGNVWSGNAWADGSGAIDL